MSGIWKKIEPSATKKKKNNSRE